MIPREYGDWSMSLLVLALLFPVLGLTLLNLHHIVGWPNVHYWGRTPWLYALADWLLWAWGVNAAVWAVVAGGAGLRLWRMY